MIYSFNLQEKIKNPVALNRAAFPLNTLTIIDLKGATDVSKNKVFNAVCDISLAYNIVPDVKLMNIRSDNRCLCYRITKENGFNGLTIFGVDSPNLPILQSHTTVKSTHFEFMALYEEAKLKRTEKAKPDQFLIEPNFYIKVDYKDKPLFKSLEQILEKLNYNVSFSLVNVTPPNNFYWHVNELGVVSAPYNTLHTDKPVYSIKEFFALAAIKLDLVLILENNFRAKLTSTYEDTYVNSGTEYNKVYLGKYWSQKLADLHITPSVWSLDGKNTSNEALNIIGVEMDLETHEFKYWDLINPQIKYIFKSSDGVWYGSTMVTDKKLSYKEVSHLYKNLEKTKNTLVNLSRVIPNTAFPECNYKNSLIYRN